MHTNSTTMDDEHILIELDANVHKHIHTNSTTMDDEYILIELDANVHKRIHTNSTTMDDEYILIGTNSTQGLFASTRKLTSGVVRLCVRGLLQ